MKLTQKKLDEMLEKACEHGACKDEIKLIKSLTISEILEHYELPFWCCWYAKFVLNSRWPEAEGCIKRDPKYAHLYARDILKSRWPESEDCIKKDEYWWSCYKVSFGINQ